MKHGVLHELAGIEMMKWFNARTLQHGHLEILPRALTYALSVVFKVKCKPVNDTLCSDFLSSPFDDEEIIRGDYQWINVSDILYMLRIIDCVDNEAVSHLHLFIYKPGKFLVNIFW